MPKGLLINITGDGKGKTTSALGTALRALGRGWNVAFFQFVKGNGKTGEKLFFGQFPHDRFVFEQLGDGFSWQPGDHAGFAQAGWRKVLPYLQGQIPCSLLILDELNIALHLEWLRTSDVLPVFQNRPEELNVIVTGRYAPQALIDASDMVSRIENIKHPFERGIPARPGIDF